MSLCGLRRKPTHDNHHRQTCTLQKGKAKEQNRALQLPALANDVRLLTSHSDDTSSLPDLPNYPLIRTRSSTNFHWARDDQLSVIIEILTQSDREGNSRRNTLSWGGSEVSLGGREERKGTNWELEIEEKGKEIEGRVPGFKRTRFNEVEERIEEGRWEESDRSTVSEWDWDREREWERERNGKASWKGEVKRKREGNMSERTRTPVTPRAIETPPRDLESISRIDSSLVFEHFTTADAWELGSALRTRLLTISTPVVINISLANQNQTLFHACTHSGVMPDSEQWVSRKRKTVLRWGCSTWYMHCKFGGDERAFGEKYGLGEKVGEYAIHGGGVPIRVTGVEGVVAVVVVSGLRQDEDHGVIVEVVRELYY